MNAPLDAWPEIPAVLFDEDMSRILGIALRTLQKRRKAHVFPIPELPRLDKRRRYSRRDVIAFLERDVNRAETKRRRA